MQCPHCSVTQEVEPKVAGALTWFAEKRPPSAEGESLAAILEAFGEEQLGKIRAAVLIHPELGSQLQREASPSAVPPASGSQFSDRPAAASTDGTRQQSADQGQQSDVLMNLIMASVMAILLIATVYGLMSGRPR
jgi:hypothetical protein